MREILFRGKKNSYHSSEWVFGSLMFYPDVNRAFFSLGDYKGIGNFVEVKKETVGEYTGLTDKHGNKIFEGDIVDVEYDINYVGVAAERIGLFEVIFYNGCFMKKGIQGKKGLYHFIGSDVCTVVGNIHDNPELLKGDAAE